MIGEVQHEQIGEIHRMPYTSAKPGECWSVRCRIKGHTKCSRSGAYLYGPNSAAEWDSLHERLCTWLLVGLPLPNRIEHMALPRHGAIRGVQWRSSEWMSAMRAARTRQLMEEEAAEVEASLTEMVREMRKRLVDDVETADDPVTLPPSIGAGTECEHSISGASSADLLS